MPVRSAAFGTLAMVSSWLLPPIGHPAHATTEPSHSENHPPAKAPAGAEIPFFQPGLWEYRRTMVKDGTPSPQISTLRKCADPTVEIREKMAELGKRSCRFAPLAHRQHRYFTSWICPTPLGPTRFHAVLIVRGPAGYTDLSEMRTTEHVARQRIEASRIGECPTNGPGRQFHPHPQVTPNL